MKKPQPKIPYVAWRDGRPRFVPSTTLRTVGFKGLDLVNDDGSWMDAAQALEWSKDFTRQMQEQARKAKPKKPAKLPPPPPAAPAFPVSLLFDQWTNAEHNPRFADLSPKAQYEYRHKGKVIQKYLPDVWRSETAALTKPICLGLYDSLRKQAGISQASATMRALGTALQWAMDRGRLPDMLVNPAHKLRMKTPDPRIRVGTPDEIMRMVAVADAIGRPEIGDMIILGVWTGQRQADRLQLTFVGRKSGEMIFRQMKTKVIVRIPESPEVTARIEASLKRRKLAELVSPHVVLDEKRWEPMDRYYYHKLYAQVRAAAARGMEATTKHPAFPPMPSLQGKAGTETPEEFEEVQTLSLNDQDLRDTSVTWLANAGCTIPQICSITGHSFASAHTILKHYLALNPDLARSAMSKMVDWWEAKDNDGPAQ